MTRMLRGTLDDALSDIKIVDYSGGLNTQEGALALSSNETPACQNVIGFPGRLLYIGGSNNVTALPVGFNNADGGIQFYDANNNKHIIVWANGNMYDTVNATLSLITANVYTSGQNIGRTILNNILYWCTATIPLRQYDGTTEKAVVSSGAAGSIAMPAGTYLCTYAGSIIVANPTYSGTTYNGSIVPSNVNDATTFLSANQTSIGQNNLIQALIPMSVAAGGIPPTSSIMLVGQVGLVMAQGAVNALKLQNVNYPIGCQDANSVVYIPTGDILGNVVYLGTDNQLHESNGITTRMISAKILNLLNTLVSNSLALNVKQKFSATYNKRFHYYLCDLGQDTQIIYKWTQMTDGSIRAGFFRLQGWPSGAYFDGTSGNGTPTNYVAANSTQAAGMYEVGVDGINFNGTQPTVYYTVPYLHANDVSMMKEWQWVNLTFNNLLPTQYVIAPTGLTDSSNTAVAGNSITFKTPQKLAAGGAVWDLSNWDAANWANIPALPTQSPAIDSKMLTGTATDASGNTVNIPLRSPAMSFKISWNAANSNSIAVFDITNFGTRFKNMGHYMTGGATGSAEQS